MKLPSLLPPNERSNPPLVVPKVPYDMVTSPCGVVTPRPERVVTLITTLVLSPYSAGGAPAITSRDWIESSGIWFEKTLLCWSVIGCPSTENEFSAWSPSPWNRPLESAAIPGVDCVTAALSEDDALSRGIRMNELRSRSEWKVESFSTRSPPASTVTDVVDPDTCRLTLTLTGTTERTSTSCAVGANPSAVTAM